MSYKLLKNSNGVQRLEDGAFIPDHPGNRDWQDYQNWLALGNTPAAAQSLEEVQADKKAEINNARQTALDAGVTYNDHVFDSDATAIANVNATLTILQNGATLPTGFTWRTKDNTDVPFTLADLQGLAAALFTASNTAYTKSWTLKTQIDAATTIDAVNAITW